MGQKVNPHGARVGVIKDWSTRWYADKKSFADNLVSDAKLRTMIKNLEFTDDKSKKAVKLSDAGVSGIDIERRCSRLSIGTGGLSGPAVKPVAVRMVHQVARAVRIPVIGLGGIMNAADAIEFLMAGAAAIERGTANFIDPTVTVKVIDGINEWLDRHGVADVHDIIGCV